MNPFSEVIMSYSTTNLTSSRAPKYIRFEASFLWETWAEERRRKMACVTLKRSLDFDPLHSPSRPIKRRRYYHSHLLQYRWSDQPVFSYACLKKQCTNVKPIIQFCPNHSFLIRCVPMGQPHGCSPSKRDTGECSSPSKPSGDPSMLCCLPSNLF